MMDWFEFKGKKCTEFGIHVDMQPAMTLPAERVTFKTVPGRSGPLTILEGDEVYDGVNFSVPCWIEDPKNIDEIAVWLRGRGNLVLANRPDGYYKARVTNQIPFTQIIRGHRSVTFNAEFRCEPFLYLHYVNRISLDMSASSASVVNPHGVASEPQIDVQATGAVKLTVNGEEISIASKTEDQETAISLTATTGGFYDQNGAVSTPSGSPCSHALVESNVSAGQRYRLHTCYNYSAGTSGHRVPFVCFFNGTTLVSVCEDTNVLENTVVNRYFTVPDGCDKMAVQSVSAATQNPELYLIEAVDIESTLTIDSAMQECYTQTESANSRVTLDEFPKLMAGVNDISWEGDDVTSIVIHPNWRKLV